MRDNPNNRMKPFVYDPEYDGTNYPEWYTSMGGVKEHLV